MRQDSVFIKIVLIALISSNEAKASCDPPLNPNQPSHKTNTPSVARGMEDAA